MAEIIIVNVKSDGIIQSQTYTKKIEFDTGKNKVSVLLYGSLENLMGPGHVKVRAFMRLSAFRRGKDNMPPGKDYDLLDYGLMEDFRISRLNLKINL